MKKLLVTLLFPASLAFSATTEAAPSAQPTITPMSASTLPLPQTKGRTGSRRVGGYNSHGKGGRYVGGRQGKR